MNIGYVIAVDYFTWDEEKQCERRSKCYLYTQGEHKIYVFHEELNNVNDDIKLFSNQTQAKKYIREHDLNHSICYENCRVEKVRIREATV